MALTLPPRSGPRPRVGSSPRLTLYAGVGAAAVVASLVVARPAVAAFGAPLLLLALTGVVFARAPHVEVDQTSLEPARSIAGDTLVVMMPVRAEPTVGRLDVRVGMAGPATVPDHPNGLITWCLTRARYHTCRTDLLTTDWGRMRLQSATIRAYGPLGLVHWTWTFPLLVTARVLPPLHRLRTLLDPPPRAAAGTHSSRARGSGLDFAELRPLVPGDRLADVNWRASARRGEIARGELLVNVRHPDRAGDVVLLLDTSADDSDERAPWLPRAGRAAWALATAHLHSHDRVGMVGFGGYTSWVTIGGGERAAYALLDKLLSVRPMMTGANRSLAWLPPRLLPVDAAVVAVTPLHALQAIDILVELRRHGRRVAAVVVDSTDLLPDDPALDLARRYWALELDRRVGVLRSAGILTVRWRADSELDQAVALLSRLARATPVVSR